MITAYITGHKTYYDGNNWRYCDNNVKIEDEIRKCPRCGRFPTKEGYDACIGYVEGAKSVCCGHGVGKPILIY